MTKSQLILSILKWNDLSQTIFGHIMFTHITNFQKSLGRCTFQTDEIQTVEVKIDKNYLKTIQHIDITNLCQNQKYR